MRITLTIDVEDGNVAVLKNQQEPVKEIVPVTQVQEVKEEQPKEDTAMFPIGNRQFGERLPKGRWAARVKPRTDEYPFNVGDAKEELQKNNISMTALAKCLGIDLPKLRNIFRYDTRRFTRKDYDVILKAIEIIKQQREVMY